MTKRIRVLILCSGNSCRSQMAEGFMRHFSGDQVSTCSAGLEAHGLNPLAVKVMADINLDISQHSSHTIDRYIDKEFDFVITVCDHAAMNCPVIGRGGLRLHWPLDDPASAEGTPEEIMRVFQRVRDEIAEKVRSWLIEQGISTNKSAD